MSEILTIIIPNWNGKDLLRQCLSSIENQSLDGRFTIIVDNGSEDGSLQMVRDEFPSVIVHSLEENLGFAKAINIGIHKSKTPFIMLLNNDTQLEIDCLNHLYNHIKAEKENCGGVECRMMNYFDRELIDSLGIQIREKRFYDIEHGTILNTVHQKKGFVLGLCAGAAIYRREFFESVGLFDERFFAGFEDVDISLRGLRKGWFFTYEPEAVIYHHKSPTFNKLSHRKHIELRKNLFLTGIKNFPRRYMINFTFQFFYVLQKDVTNIIKHLRKKTV